MTERLRALLDRPLDPAAARAALVLTLAIGIGFAIVVAFAGVDHGQVAKKGSVPPTLHRRSASPVPGSFPPAAELPPQDPQDRPGTVAHRRGARELAHHRALQHVPYRSGGVSIDLVGARRGLAVLAVRAPTRAAALRGWHSFLRRFDDPGTDYLPRFEGGRG